MFLLLFPWLLIFKRRVVFSALEQSDLTRGETWISWGLLQGINHLTTKLSIINIDIVSFFYQINYTDLNTDKKSPTGQQQQHDSQKPVHFLSLNFFPYEISIHMKRVSAVFHTVPIDRCCDPLSLRSKSHPFLPSSLLQHFVPNVALCYLMLSIVREIKAVQWRIPFHSFDFGCKLFQFFWRKEVTKVMFALSFLGEFFRFF